MPPSPPSLSDFLSSAGLGGAASAVGTAASAVGSAANTVTSTVGAALGGGAATPAPTDSTTPPALSDFLQSAGLGPSPAPATPTNVPTSSDTLTNPLANPTPPAGDTHQSQFGMGLSTADAYAACGIAASVGFARQMGRNPTAQEATDLARAVGWTSDAGMSGVTGEQALLTKLGVATKLETTVDWNHVQQDSMNGNPVILDTPGHYYYIDSARQGADGTVQYHVGTSGLDLRGGSAWMSQAQINGMSQSGGAVRAALYADNPNSPHPSVASTTSSATATTAGLSGGGALAGRIGDAGQAILSGGAQAASWLGVEGQKALQSVLVTEGGLNNARGDAGSSAGPLQFFGEEGGRAGQLNAYAQHLGVSLAQARDAIEQAPLDAVRWAIGTPDSPGYLGAAIQSGVKLGLVGSDLATFAQQHGQVSVSPERAGQNYDAMFGGGGGPVGGGASDTTTPVGPDYTKLSADAQANTAQAQVQTTSATSDLDALNRQTAQKQSDLNAEATQRETALKQALDATVASGAATPVPSAPTPATPTAVTSTNQPDQNPVQRFGSQLTDAITGLVQHLTGGGGATMAANLPADTSVNPSPAAQPKDQYGNVISTDVSNVPRGGQPTPSDTLTNPIARPNLYTPPEGPLAGQTPQPTVFDQLREAANQPIPSGPGTAGVNVGGNQVVPDVLTPLLSAPGQFQGATGQGDILGAAGVILGAAADVTSLSPGAGGEKAAAELADVVAKSSPEALEAALSSAQQAVTDLRAKFPQMSEGSITASGPGKALAALQNAAPDAASAVEATAPDVAAAAERGIGSAGEPSVPGIAPNAAAADLTPPAQQGDTLLQGLVNMAKDRGYDVSELEAQLPRTPAETRPASATTGGVGEPPTPPVEPPTTTGTPPGAPAEPPAVPGEPPTAIDILKAVHSGNVISGLSTLTHVAVNSIIAPAWSLATQTGKDVVQTLASPLTGQGAQFDRIAGRSIGMSAALARSGDAFGSAIRDFYAAPTNIANRVDNPILAGALRAQQATGAALHSAFQNVAQQAIKHMELGAQAGEVASSEGLHGPDFVRRVSELINDPSLGLNQQAIAKAEDIGSRGALRGEAGTIQTVMQNIANVPVAGNALFPVVKIASQAFAQGIEKSPIGLVGTGFDVLRGLRGAGPYASGFNKLGGAVTPLSDRLTNNIAGTALTGYLASKALDGSITGNGPADPDERKMLVSKGWQAHSVYVPGLGYVDYHLLGPLAVPFALAGNYADATNYPQKQVDPTTGLKTTTAATPEQVALDMADRTVSYLGDATGLRTLSDLYTVIHGGPTAQSVIAQFGGSLAGGFVPESGLVASLTRAADTEGARKPVSGDIGQVLSQNLPGLRQNVPLSRDVLGRVLPNEQAGLGTFMAKRGSSPDVITATSGGSGGPVINEVMRLRQAGQAIGITPPSVSGIGGYQGAAQAPDQQSLIQRTVGNAVNLYALNTMADPAYAGLTDAQKANALSKSLATARKAANIDLGGNIARDPHNTALLQWQQTPQYRNVTGTPQQIAEQNLQIAEAKTKLAQYTKALGPSRGEMRMRIDDPAGFKLTQRDRVDTERLNKLKAAIDAATGGALTNTSNTAAAGGLVGAGTDVLSLGTPP